MSRLQAGHGEHIVILHIAKGVTGMTHINGHCRLKPQFAQHAPVDGHEIEIILCTGSQQHPLVADFVNGVARQLSRINFTERHSKNLLAYLLLCILLSYYTPTAICKRFCVFSCA